MYPQSGYVVSTEWICKTGRLVFELTTILVCVSPCERWTVFAAAGHSGNCFQTTCVDLVLPTQNCVVIGLIGVHVGWTARCCLVFLPKSSW